MCLWLLLLYGYPCLFAQGWSYIQVDSVKEKWGDWDAPEWLRYFGLDAGDVDRDGNLDILSGRYIYHNPGGSMASPWKRTVLDDNVDGILMLDIDRDPFADFIAMALPDLFWYEATNLTGTRYIRKKIAEIPATSHVNSQGFARAQIVPGGPEEILIAGNGDVYMITIEWDESATAPRFQRILIGENTSDEGIGVGDIDGDGDLDIAAGRRPEGEDEPRILVWFENPGEPTATWKDREVAQTRHPIDRVGVADLNGNGRADLVLTEERYPGLEPDASLWIYFQGSDGSWEAQTLVTQYSMNNLDLADPDLDGDIDILTAEHKGAALEVQLWRNDGKGIFQKEGIDTGKENHLGTKWVDLDGDGDLDIIGAGWDAHQFMHVWRNDRLRDFGQGALFRAYPWKPHTSEDSGGYLRVGGRLDYREADGPYPGEALRNGSLPLMHKLDLEEAFHAEVFLEKVQSHEDTKGLEIRFNEGQWIPLPDPPRIPRPPSDYMFHTNVRAAIPLEDLRPEENTFDLRVSGEQSWDWPQNLVYGLVLRVYYPTESGFGAQLRIDGLSEGDTLEAEQQIGISGGQLSNIENVSYIGLYEDVNRQGDGRYRRWQYDYHRGRWKGFGPQARTAPFNAIWKTREIPAQSQPIALTAAIRSTDGFTRILPPVRGLLQADATTRVLKPYRQEPFWTTRNGEHSQRLFIENAIGPADRLQLLWRSWSPCYNEGLRINGQIVKADANTPCYDSYWHTEAFETATELFNVGVNTVTTLKTPLVNGEMVHGMEVQWPGIMGLHILKEEREQNPYPTETVMYQGRPHWRVHTPALTYYIDKAGGGLSRLIDPKGNDWISFKMEPWGDYPQAASGAFRGLPNAVFGEDPNAGAGHPGHDKCKTGNPRPGILVSHSTDMKWTWTWTFQDDHLLLSFEDTDGPYWFLYEGTPGGNFRPEEYLFGTDQGRGGDILPDFFDKKFDEATYRWAYFGQKELPYTLYLVQLEVDNTPDVLAYLGDSSEALESSDGMTVFGFGRDTSDQPLLRGPNKFLIGLYPREIDTPEAYDELKGHITTQIFNYTHEDSKK